MHVEAESDKNSNLRRSLEKLEYFGTENREKNKKDKNIYISTHMCVTVCVCVYEERDKERWTTIKPFETGNTIVCGCFTRLCSYHQMKRRPSDVGNDGVKSQ